MVTTSGVRRAGKNCSAAAKSKSTSAKREQGGWWVVAVAVLEVALWSLWRWRDSTCDGHGRAPRPAARVHQLPDIVGGTLAVWTADYTRARLLTRTPISSAKIIIGRMSLVSWIYQLDWEKNLY